MGKADFEWDTTIKVIPDAEAYFLFARPRTMRDRLLEWMLPALWLLVFVVVVAALW
jgi:hypothetical protein